MKEKLEELMGKINSLEKGGDIRIVHKNDELRIRSFGDYYAFWMSAPMVDGCVRFNSMKVLEKNNDAGLYLYWDNAFVGVISIRG